MLLVGDKDSVSGSGSFGLVHQRNIPPSSGLEDFLIFECCFYGPSDRIGSRCCGGHLEVMAATPIFTMLSQLPQKLFEQARATKIKLAAPIHLCQLGLKGLIRLLGECSLQVGEQGPT